MPIIRTKRKRHNFSIIDNSGLMDGSLSWKATGMLAFLMTKPDDWQISVENLTGAKRDGRDSTISALEELKKAGYVYFRRFRVNGRFESEYLVFETQEDLQEWLEEQGVDHDGKSVVANHNGKTTTEKPTRKNQRGKTATENPTLLINKEVITEELITDLLITEHSPPTPSHEGEESEREILAVEPEPEPTKTNNQPLPSPPTQTQPLTQVTNPVDDPFFRRRRKPNEGYQKPPLEKWEIAPGQPYPYFWQWKEAHYKKQGDRWADSAKSNAYSEFYNNRQRTTNALWVEFLGFYNITLDNALAIQAAGITPTLPPCFTNSETVTEEKVSAKLRQLVSGVPTPSSAAQALGADVLVALPGVAATSSSNEAIPWTPPNDGLDGLRSNIKAQIDAIAQSKALEKSQRIPDPVTNQLERYRSWLQGEQPALRKEAQRWANRRSDLELVYDEEGNLIDFKRVESA